MDLLRNNNVYVSRDKAEYSNVPPFNPSEKYPEYSGNISINQDNPAYRAFRQLLKYMRLDSPNIDSQGWNPLGELILPGNTVVLKPNFVKHENSRKGALSRLDLDCLVTHGSVIRAVVDYVAIALKGEGNIVIADCPLQSAQWDKLVSMVGLDAIIDDFRIRFPEINIVLHDYRLWRSVYNGSHMMSGELDSLGLGLHQEIDLGCHSLLIPLMKNGVEFGVSHYPREKLRAAHTLETNKYICPKEFLNADVMINLPKMKSHKKAGFTCALKNFVGTNGHKDYLPHFRFGSPKRGGDEYPDGGWLWELFWSLSHRSWDSESICEKRRWQRISRIVQLIGFASGQISRSENQKGCGSWCGNDTIWRTILDINRAFFYYDREKGRIGSSPWKKTKYMVFLDGLIGGQKNSPLSPEPVRSGFLLGAVNPLALDTVAVALMGYDYRKVKQIAEGYKVSDLPLANFGPEEIEIVGDLPINRVEDIYKSGLFIPFEPSEGWKGTVEWQQ